MEHYAGFLIIVAVCIELVLVLNKRDAVDNTVDNVQEPMVPIFSQMATESREYSPMEIRVMDKEAQYRRERRAARMGYCLLPREANLRKIPESKRT